MVKVKIPNQKARNSRKEAEVVIQEIEIEFIVAEKLASPNFQSNDERQKCSQLLLSKFDGLYDTIHLKFKCETKCKNFPIF